MSSIRYSKRLMMTENFGVQQVSKQIFVLPVGHSLDGIGVGVILALCVCQIFQVLFLGKLLIDCDA